MQLITQQTAAYVSGGKAETVSKRAEDIISDLKKIDGYMTKTAEQLDRLEENIQLVRNKARN